MALFCSNFVYFMVVVDYFLTIKSTQGFGRFGFILKCYLCLWSWASIVHVVMVFCLFRGIDFCCQNFAIQYCLFFVILQSGDAGAMAFTHNFFKQLMWRSSKAHVSDELQIPPQEERVSWLFLSPIEGHFYQRQHETCVDDAREVVESFKDDARKQEGSGFHLFSIISSDIKL